MIAAVMVETSELLSTVAASAIAGIGVTVVFAVALRGTIQFADLSREERPLAAAVAGAVALMALLACLAAVVAGIFVMTQ